jgi:hypothetical protein
MFVRVLTVLAALGAFTLAGCGPGKLNENKKFTLDTGEGKAFDIPKASKAQKINVEFDSSEGEVSVYVFKDDDAKGEDGIIGSDPKKALASKRAKADTISADVPENTPVRVIVRNPTKKTEVNLKMTN